MIIADIFCGKKVAVFGLGGSGIVTAQSLKQGGAEVIAFDDNAQAREQAREKGIFVADLHQISWQTMAALVLAPGVPLTHPEPHWVVKLAHKAGVEIIGDLEIFARIWNEAKKSYKKGPEAVQVIAITGTNGKSTTTMLIAHLLQYAGFNVQVGGNIGTPALALAPFQPERVYVLECSSFQIELAPSFKPDVAVLLNLSYDHIDRHGDFARYVQIKQALLEQAQKAVIALDDASSAGVAQQLSCLNKPLTYLCAYEKRGADYFAVETKLYKKGAGQETCLLDLAGITTLRGKHNAQNSLAALAVLENFSLPSDKVLEAFQSFKGLPHRMQQVRKIKNTLFINDSKATNAEAAAPALASFAHIYWIIGGLAKQGGIEALREFFPKITKAYLIGEAAPHFQKTIADSFPVMCCGTLERAVAAAAQDASQDQAPNVVLLSPACASYDQFKNYAARGESFINLVNKL